MAFAQRGDEPPVCVIHACSGEETMHFESEEAPERHLRALITSLGPVPGRHLDSDNPQNVI